MELNLREQVDTLLSGITITILKSNSPLKNDCR